METVLRLIHGFNLLVAWWVAGSLVLGGVWFAWDAWRTRHVPAPPLRGKASMEAIVAAEREDARQAALARERVLRRRRVARLPTLAIRAGRALARGLRRVAAR